MRRQLLKFIIETEININSATPYGLNENESPSFLLLYTFYYDQIKSTGAIKCRTIRIALCTRHQYSDSVAWRKRRYQRVCNLDSVAADVRFRSTFYLNSQITWRTQHPLSEDINELLPVGGTGKCPNYYRKSRFIYIFIMW